jgi:hypothetical protein
MIGAGLANIEFDRESVIVVPGFGSIQRSHRVLHKLSVILGLDHDANAMLVVVDLRLLCADQGAVRRAEEILVDVGQVEAFFNQNRNRTHGF